MYNNVSEYREYKYYQNVLFNGLNEDYKWLNDELKLKKFYEVCNYYVSNNFITYDEVKNIKEVLKFLLKEQDEKSAEKIGLIHYIYNKALFSMSKEQNKKLCKEEYKKRKIKNIDIEMKTLIKNDLEIIDKMLVSDLDFCRNLNDLVNNKNYIYGITAIIEECPQILKYNDFCNRLKRVLKLKQRIKNEKNVKTLEKKIKIKRRFNNESHNL